MVQSDWLYAMRVTRQGQVFGRQKTMLIPRFFK